MIVKEKIYINTNELGPNLGSLCKKFTYKNPEFEEKRRLKFSVANTPEYLFHYKIETLSGNRLLILPRGGLLKVKEFFKEKNLPIKFVDKRVSHPKIDCKLVKTELDSHQKQIVDVLRDNEGGLIEASPGAGKTISILGLISEVKQPTLILVHEHRLSSQWRGEINKRLKGDFILGELNGDTKKDGDVVIGIINTIHTMYKETPEYFDKFGMIVIDETHRLPAETFINFVNNIPAKYRIGVTGTIKRRDGKHILIYDILGEKLIGIDAQDIKHRITNFEYEVVNTNINFEIPTITRWTGKKRERVLDITKCIGLLSENEERNTLIVSKVIESIEKGYFPLVLSDRIEHNKKLHEHIISLGYKAVLLIGATRKSTKWEEIRKDETIQCIIANTKIASEALDLPRLSALFSTCPTSNLPKIKQQAGRIRRHLDGKITPKIFDVCDNLAFFINDSGQKVDLLRILASKRVNYYSKLKKEYEEKKDPVV